MDNHGKIKGNAFDIFSAIASNDAESVKDILSTQTVDLSIKIKDSTVLSHVLFKKLPNNDILEHILQYMNNNELIKTKTKTNQWLDILSCDGNGRCEPPLITACRQGNHDAFHALVKADADINATDSSNHSVLWMAVRQINEDMVHSLISYGVKVNGFDKWSDSALYMSLKYPRRHLLAAILIRNGSRVIFPCEPRDKTLLFWSLFHSQSKIITLLAYTGYNITKESYLKLHLPETMEKDEDFNDWLRVELTTPPTLLRQSRVAIRNAVIDSSKGSHFLHKLDQLPLPKKLREYLKLFDIS